MSDWYYAVNNEQKGPVTEAALRAQLTGGQLRPESLVWTDGMDNWAPAASVPALALPAPSPMAAPSFAKLSPAPEVVTAAKPGINNPESVQPVKMASLFGPGEALEVDAEDAENNKIFGILAYLGILCLVPLFAAKQSPFARYHANQGLVLFVTEIALGIVLDIVNYILAFFHLGFISVVLGLVWLGVIVLLIIGIINAAAGKCVPLPVIGGFKLIK